MTEQSKPARRPAPKSVPRNLIMTFMASREVRTERGEVAAARLRPGDKILSGADAVLSVVSVLVGEPSPDRKDPLVRIVLGAGRAAASAASAFPVAGRVSPEDGRLHLG